MRKKILFYLFMIGLFFSSLSHAASQKFLTIADIHFDPFLTCNKTVIPCPLITRLQQTEAQEWPAIFEQYDRTMAQYGKDTPYTLLKSSVLAWQNANHTNQLQWVFVLGDFLAHDFKKRYQRFSGDRSQEGYQEFVRKTLEFLTAEIKQAFPKITIYAALGNNDSYYGNYGIVPQGRFIEDVSHLWQNFFNSAADKTAFTNQFKKDGYYAMVPAGYPGLRIIVLNTVLFAEDAARPAIQKAGQQELNWLHSQLSDARAHHQKVWLAFHIPFGIDVYRTVKFNFSNVHSFWQPEFTQQFRAQLQQFSSTITALLPAHIHMDAFQLIASGPTAGIPASFTPSISPIYGNNPGFKLYEFNPQQFTLNDFNVYFLKVNTSSPEWQKEYSFNQTYQPNCQTCTLLEGMQYFTRNPQLLTVYKRYYSVQGLPQPIALVKTNVPYYRCNMYTFNEQEFSSCMQA